MLGEINLVMTLAPWWAYAVIALATFALIVQLVRHGHTVVLAVVEGVIIGLALAFVAGTITQAISDETLPTINTHPSAGIASKSPATL